MQVTADEKKKLDEFFAVNSYVRGSYDTAADFKKLNDDLVKLAKTGANRLFYLALPPGTYESVATMIKATCMSPRSVNVCTSQPTRLVSGTCAATWRMAEMNFEGIIQFMTLFGKWHALQ